MSNERRYHILGVLGKGGFGTVYEARLQTAGDFRKNVALKILNPEMVGINDIAIRLKDEAKLLGLLSHRAIVAVDELVMLDGCWAIVMELVQGLSIHQLLQQVKQFPLGIALEVTQEVAGAIHAAYNQPVEGGSLQVLHRDLKPSNIQLTPSAEVKVLDFGVARAVFDSREAETHSLVFGSLGYMAPERMYGKDSPEGDVYALGVCLYEMLAGKRLGNACSSSTSHLVMLNEAMEVLHSQGIPIEVTELLLLALAYDQRLRPTARDFQRSLRLLRATYPDPWLNDWVEQVYADVPPKKLLPGPWSNRVLQQGISAPPLPPPPIKPPPPPRRPAFVPSAETKALPQATAPLSVSVTEAPPPTTNPEIVESLPPKNLSNRYPPPKEPPPLIKSEQSLRIEPTSEPTLGGIEIPTPPYPSKKVTKRKWPILAFAFFGIVSFTGSTVFAFSRFVNSPVKQHVTDPNKEIPEEKPIEEENPKEENLLEKEQDIKPEKIESKKAVTKQSPVAKPVVKIEPLDPEPTEKSEKPKEPSPWITEEKPNEEEKPEEKLITTTETPEAIIKISTIESGTAEKKDPPKEDYNGPSEETIRSSLGYITLHSDASKVVFHGAAGSFVSGGWVPPGNYKIWASFNNNQGFFMSSEVVVKAGYESVVQCRTSHELCVPKPPRKSE